MSPGKVRFSGLAHPLALLFLAAVAPACGGGGGGSSKPGAAVLSATITTPAGTQTGVVPISYTLIDPAGLTCVVAVEFSTNGGGVWQPAAPAPGGDGTSDLASSPTGVPHTFAWNSVADGVAPGGPDSNVRFRITPATTVPGASGATQNFTVDNAGNTAPTASITPLVGVQSGLVPVSYALTDAQSDPCSVQASFSVDGGTSFSPATQGPGGDGASNLTSSGGGTAHTYLWNSVADGVAPSGANSTVRFRLQPADGTAGTAATTADFSVDNSGKSSGSSLAGYPIQINGSSSSDWAIAAAQDGRHLYTLGFEDFDFESASGGDVGWRLRKRTIRTGAAEAGFGSGGTLSANPGPGLDVPCKVVVSGASLFVLIAQETALGSRAFVLRIEKRSAATGALIAAFGSGGVVTTSNPAAYDGIPLPWGLASDGSFLYVAGPQNGPSGDASWRIEKRDKTTGALIPGFGTAGRIDENPTSAADGCFALLVDAGSMWLVGMEGVHGTSASNGRIRIERRQVLTGALDPAFGSGGVVTPDPGSGDDIGEDAVADGTSLFVFSRVETAQGSGLFQGRLEKRDLATGALGPVVTTSGSDPTGELPFGHLALDGGALFVCQADGTPDAKWNLEKRSTSTLSLVGTFGTGGVLQINPSPDGYDRPLGIVAVGGVVLLAGMDSAASDEQWRIEARWR